MSEEKRIIEINGIKMEIDLRTATSRTVDTFCIGDKVKILLKEYGDSFRSYAGAIVGFDAFQQRPTIIVAYLAGGYSAAEIKFAYINADKQGC